MNLDQLVSLIGESGEITSVGEGTEQSPVVFEIDNTPGQHLAIEVSIWCGSHLNERDVVYLHSEVTVGRHRSRVFREVLTWFDDYHHSVPLETLHLIGPAETPNETTRLTVEHRIVDDDVTSQRLSEVLHSLRTVVDDVRNAVYCVRSRLNTRAQQACQRGLPSTLAELDKLVGLAPVKQLLRQLAAQQHVAQLRRMNGRRVSLPSPNLVFTGNPGTGKTTVARLVGRMYREFGLLSKGHVVEVDRSGLVAAYIGQTALKTQKACDEAQGGVLFIDEAYSLAGTGMDFGREAIETLLVNMESRRDDFVVIVAGYPEEMGRFIAANPGLESRFDLNIPFPDYSTEELVEIFVNLLDAYDYVLEPEALRALPTCVKSLQRGANFGNAREVRKLFQRTVANHALVVNRAVSDGLITNTQMLNTITTSMLPYQSFPKPMGPPQPAPHRQPPTAGYL